MRNDVIERIETRDRFADYCLWDYRPAADPIGKLRSCSLLWAFLDIVGWTSDVRSCCEAFRRELGAFNTVWGIKQRAGLYSLQLYFYDYARVDRQVSVARILATLAPWLKSRLEISDRKPYFMVSLDLDEAIVAGRSLDELSVYIGHPGSAVSAGLCYNVSDKGLRLDNIYSFFDRAGQLVDIRAKILCSAHLDLRSDTLDAILPGNLMTCGTIVVANKRLNDGVYFSRLPAPGFFEFVRNGGFPSAFVDFVEDHRAELDHFLFDVGFDYVTKAGVTEIVKTAIYGLL